MKLNPNSFAFGSVIFVAACGGAAIAVPGIDSLGAAFVSMFNADPNAEPVNAQDVPLQVSFTADPFNP